MILLDVLLIRRCRLLFEVRFVLCVMMVVVILSLSLIRFVLVMIIRMLGILT